MTRILADIPDDDIAWLDSVARDQGKSRASVLRDAVSSYKAQSPVSGGPDWIDRGFGLWKNRGDIGDAVDWQRRERASWTRAWDDDHEAVKAEFSELFDDEDDRQRQIYLDMAAGRYPVPRKPDPR
jgi:hypothetical protein